MKVAKRASIGVHDTMETASLATEYSGVVKNVLSSKNIYRVKKNVAE